MAQLLGGFQHLHWAAVLSAFVQVVLIDLTLASDNAIAVGMAASGLPTPKRHLAISLGLGGAVVMLGGLAFFAIGLLKAGGGGLIVAGGLLLLLISWQMWRDLRLQHRRHDHLPHVTHPEGAKTLMGALVQILIADVSTSMDNVLAVAGVARNQPPWVLYAGLTLSVALTGFAAVGVARLLHRWPWIGYIGLAIVVFVAGHMVFDGVVQLNARPAR
jgi:YjbE family integral membrane protein